MEVSYGHNSTDGRELGGSQLWAQQYGWQRARWKPVMASYGSQKVIATC